MENVLLIAFVLFLGYKIFTGGGWGPSHHHGGGEGEGKGKGGHGGGGCCPLAWERVRTMSLWARIRRNWTDFLARLAKTNRDTYRGGTPDCCSPSRKK